jgi:hypothetical protein
MTSLPLLQLPTQPLTGPYASPGHGRQNRGHFIEKRLPSADAKKLLETGQEGPEPRVRPTRILRVIDLYMVRDFEIYRMSYF